MKELDIIPIFNVPYSPEYNPIEIVFSLIKRIFKQKRLASLAQGEKFDFKAGIKHSLTKLNNNTVKSICQNVLASVYENE